jgi:Tol biopolymer transport system component
MRRGRRLLAVVVVLVAGALTGCDAPSPWQVVLVSAAVDGGAAGGMSGWPVISPDGTKVAFESEASSLVARDTNGVNDVFVRDLTTGRTELVSIDASGTDSGDGRSGGDGAAGSQGPTFSPDGTLLLFRSSASDLVEGDQTGWELFLRDLEDGTTRLVSTTGSPHGEFLWGRFSPDGSKVVYNTGSIPTSGDVFVYDIATGRTTLVSAAATGGGGGNGPSYRAVVGPDGNKVAFTSLATNLGPIDTNGTYDVYLRDLAAGTTTLLSTSGSGAADGWSDQAVFSPDGTKVAFASQASNLGPTDSNGSPDVYLSDLTTGRASLVSINGAGTDSGNDESGGNQNSHPFLPDGRIVFASGASDLTPADDNGYPDIFVHDPSTGRTELVSVNAAGTNSGNSLSAAARVTSDGRVIFQSRARDLVTNDHNNDDDIFVRDLHTRTTTLVTTTLDGREAAGGSETFGDGHQIMSRDGRRIVFQSWSTRLVPGDGGPSDRNVFVTTFGAADLQLTADATPNPVATGRKITYHVRLGNNGPTQPDEATVALLLDDHASFATVDSTTGTCTPPTPDGPPLVTCRFDKVPTGDVASVTVTATVTAPPGTTLRTLAATTSPTVDPQGDNDFVAIESQVIG